MAMWIYLEAGCVPQIFRIQTRTHSEAIQFSSRSGAWAENSHSNVD